MKNEGCDPRVLDCRGVRIRFYNGDLIDKHETEQAKHSTVHSTVIPRAETESTMTLNSTTTSFTTLSTKTRTFVFTKTSQGESIADELINM